MYCFVSLQLFSFVSKKVAEPGGSRCLSGRWSLITRREWSVSARNTSLYLGFKKKEENVYHRQHGRIEEHEPYEWNLEERGEKVFQGLGWQLCYHGAHEYRQPSNIVVTHTRQLTLHISAVCLARTPTFPAVPGKSCPLPRMLCLESRHKEKCQVLRYLLVTTDRCDVYAFLLWMHLIAECIW